MGLAGRVLGLDYGARRIGLALSDPAAQLAFPAGTLQRRDLEHDLAELSRQIEEKEVVRVVVGLPLHMDGREGPEAAAARAFAERLAVASGRPVELLDERWTTREAERTLRETGAGKRRRQELDTLAATLLLRTYLEREAGRARGCAP